MLIGYYLEHWWRTSSSSSRMDGKAPPNWRLFHHLGEYESRFAGPQARRSHLRPILEKNL